MRGELKLNRYLVAFALIFVAPVAVLAQPPRPRPEPDAELRDYIKANYTKYEYRVPMRDGVKLFTAVYVPKDDSQSYPILLIRTPYSCQPYGVDRYPDSLRPGEKFTRAGYIFVYQDVRGR